MIFKLKREALAYAATQSGSWEVFKDPRFPKLPWVATCIPTSLKSLEELNAGDPHGRNE